MSSRLAVVIPTIGRIGRLRLTVACLGPSAGRIAELIIVADGVDPGGVEAIESLVDRCRLPFPVRIEATAGLGRAGARNLGARRADSDHLLFLDDDILVAPGSVVAIDEALASAAIVAGAIVELPELVRAEDPSRHPAFAAQLDLDRLRTSGFAAGRRRLLRTPLQQLASRLDRDGWVGGPLDFLCCAGAMLATTSECFAALGGFDAGFGSDWGCEDLEWGWRATAAAQHSVRRVDPGGFHMTHPRPGRWDEHDRSLRRFTERHPVPPVLALGRLLSPTGSPDDYLAALDAVGVQW